MPRNAKTWKFERALLHNEEPFRPQTLQNVKLLVGLISDETKTSKELIVSFFFILKNEDVTWKPCIQRGAKGPSWP